MRKRGVRRVSSMDEPWDDFLNYPRAFTPRASHRRPSRHLSRSLGAARKHHLFLVAGCRKCQAMLCLPLAPLIIRWGAETPIEPMAKALRCTRCGNRGVSLQEPSWEAGFQRSIPESSRWTGSQDWHPALGAFSVDDMCNAYSMTRSREAIRALFRVSDNRLPAIIPPQPEIWPYYNAPVVRLAADGEREVVYMTFAFPLVRKGLAPKPVTNIRDDKAMNIWFWRESFNLRRCLVPVTSYCDPDEKKPVSWHWFAVEPAAERPLFACPGVWKRHSGTLRKKDPDVETDVFAFMTTVPNALAETINHERMPVIFTEEYEFNTWLNGTPEEAHALVRSFPAERMRIVQSGKKQPDLLGAA
jgi:putative SOS response-associated peptidase YedK